MKQTLTHVVKLLLATVLTAGASASLLQAQLPQDVGKWLSRGAVADPRVGAVAVTLDDGRTVIAGGTLEDGSVTGSVTVYDPVANTTMAAGQLLAPRVYASATLLADGRVLIAGGLVGGAPSADVEIFDLATGASAVAATMTDARAWHASARLFDGAVLIVGGTTSDGTALSSAEIFDPAANNVYPAGTMTTPRVGASATATIDHRVLIAGGFNGTRDLKTAEIYDISTGGFTIVPTLMSVARSGHTALLLPHNGGVLLAGGSAGGTPLTTTDLFVPAIFPDPYSWGMGGFAPTGSLTAPRAFAIGGSLGDNGFAYVAGGGPADAEAYRFATIKTDKVDYYPGEPAVITGSGWQPGEEVSLLFQEDPAVHDDYQLTVTADPNGDIYWDQWAPDWHDLGVRFYLTAQDSRSHVQMTFTDGPKIGAVSVGAQSTNPLPNTAASTTSFSVATARAGNGTVNGTFSVVFSGPAPAGITWSFSPPTFTANGNDDFPVSILTFTTNGATPAGSYAFTARTADGGEVSTGAGTLVVGAAAAATKLGFLQQPTSATVATAISPAVAVHILDSSNNLVTTDTRNVTLVIGSNPGSGTLSGTTTIAAVGGIATFSNLSIDNAGSGYTLVASSAPVLVPATSSTFNIGKAGQTITFAPLASRTFGDADFVVNATASSGLGVSFSSQTAAVCSVLGNSVHIISAGTCTIRASQAGNANFNAAPNVDQTFTVLKATPVITWPTPASITYSTALSATQLNAGTPVAGTFTYTPAIGTVLSAGDAQLLSVAFAPDDAANYNAVPVTTVLIDVLKATPVITWATPASITYGTALSGTQLNASTPVDGTFTYTPAAGTVLNAGNAQVLSVAFAPADAANYNAVPVTTVLIDVLKATPVITWATPASITYGTALSAVQLNAGTPVAGTFTYTPAIGTVLSAGDAQLLSVAFAPDDAANYNAVPVTTVLIDVLKATPVITWATPASITYGTALSAVQLNAGTPVAGTFTYTPAIGTVLSAGDAQLLSVAFAPDDAANYNAVPVTTVLIDVLKATPVISWPTPAPITYGAALGATQLSASTPVDGTFTYTPAAGTVLNAGNAQVLSVAFAPADAANYNAVPVTTVLIDVLKATPVITWPTPTAITYGTALSAVQLSASTPVDGTFTYTPAAGTVLNAGNAQVLSVAFAPADAANYNAVPVTTVLIDVLKATPVITWPTPTAITYGTALSAVQLSASTPVDGTFTYTPAAGTVLNAGNAQVLSVAFAPADAANYNAVPVTTVLIDVQRRALTVTATGINKTYDGTDAASVALSDDRRSGDNGLTVNFATATFNNRNVGSGKPITVNAITVTGTGADNYTFNTSASAVADIIVRPLQITAVSDSRVYNGTRSSVGMPTVGTLYIPDTVTGLVQEFDSRHVGINKTLSVSAYIVNDGNGGNNYAVTTVPNTTGVITQRGLTVTGITANNKPFDGNTTSTLNLGAANLVGVISPDVVSLNLGGAVGTFTSSDVGTWPVAISGLALAGSDKDNYSLAQPSTTATIGAWSVVGFHTPVGIVNSYAGTPTDAPAIWNTIKGGQAVPLKFNLLATAGGTELTNVNDVLGFSLASLPCSAGGEDPVDPDFVTTGATTLRYSGGQFIQNWDTPKGANKCYRITMTARDRSTLSAFFKTK